MSDQNGDFIEIETVSKKKVTLRKCVTRLELAGFRAILEELGQLHGSYTTILERLTKVQDAKETVAEKRVEMFDAIASLESSFTRRSLPIYNAMSAALLKKQEKGTVITDLDVIDLAEVAAQFLEKQMLTGEERKNS